MLNKWRKFEKHRRKGKSSLIHSAALTWRFMYVLPATFPISFFSPSFLHFTFQITQYFKYKKSIHHLDSTDMNPFPHLLQIFYFCKKYNIIINAPVYTFLSPFPAQRKPVTGSWYISFQSIRSLVHVCRKHTVLFSAYLHFISLISHYICYATCLYSLFIVCLRFHLVSCRLSSF